MDNSLLAVRDINHKYIVVDWRNIMKKKNKLMAAVFALILGVSTVMPGMQAQA